MRRFWRRRPALRPVGPPRGLPGEPDHEFGQMIGSFHQDMFADGETLDEIIEGGRDWPPWLIRKASKTGRRVLEEGHDEQELKAILAAHGFCLVPEACGYAGHRAFLEHLAGRWDAFMAGLAPEAFAEPEPPPPMRELTPAEKAALTSLLRDNFSKPSRRSYASTLARWSAQHSPQVLRDARSAAKAVRDGPPFNDAMTAVVEELGLGYDLWEHDRAGVGGFLEAICDELSRALGEPLEYDYGDE